jgi:hypothetical protein
MKRFYFSIHPAFLDLARTASSYIEHGKIDSVTRLELALRLAEFEGALSVAQELLPHLK